MSGEGAWGFFLEPRVSRDGDPDDMLKHLDQKDEELDDVFGCNVGKPKQTGDTMASDCGLDYGGQGDRLGVYDFSLYSSKLSI